MGMLNSNSRKRPLLMISPIGDVIQRSKSKIIHISVGANRGRKVIMTLKRSIVDYFL